MNWRWNFLSSIVTLETIRRLPKSRLRPTASASVGRVARAASALDISVSRNERRHCCVRESDMSRALLKPFVVCSALFCAGLSTLNLADAQTRPAQTKKHARMPMDAAARMLDEDTNMKNL